MKKKKKGIEPVADLDVFQHFKRIVDQIQNDLDAKYKANLTDRKIQKGKMMNLQMRIRDDHRPVAEKLEREYFTLERNMKKNTQQAVDLKNIELERVQKGGITYSEAQIRIKEIERIKEKSKKKIEANLADLVRIAKEKEFEILGLQIEWLNARETIASIERNSRDLAIQMLRDHATAEEKRQQTTALAMPEMNAELKQKTETFQNFKTDGITFPGQINVDSFIELRALIFDVRIPKKFIPELLKLIDGVKDQDHKFAIYLDNQFPRGEGLRIVEIAKTTLTQAIEKEVKNVGE